MIPSSTVAEKHVVPALSAHVITEALALRRFTQLLDTEHTLGSRQPKALLVSPQLPEVYRGGLAAHAGERSPLKAAHLRSLCQTFGRLPDPRSRCARAYPLGAVLTLVALGLLRGAVHLSTIVRLASKLSQIQRRNLGLPFKKGLLSRICG